MRRNLGVLINGNMVNLFIHSWARVLSTRHSCWNLTAFPMDETEGAHSPFPWLLRHLQIPLNLLCCLGLTSSSMTAMLLCSVLLTIPPFCESERHLRAQTLLITGHILSLSPMQASLSIQFSRQEYWSGVPFPPPGDLPNPGIKPACLESPTLLGDSLPPEAPGKPQR